MAQEFINDAGEKALAGAAKKNAENKTETQAVSAAPEQKVKKPGRFAEILATNFGIGKDKYLAQLDAYTDSADEDPEKAADDIQQDADKTVADEATEVAETINNERKIIKTISSRAGFDSAAAAEAETKLKQLENEAKTTAETATAEVKKPSLWSGLLEKFGKGDHWTRTEAHLDDTPEAPKPKTKAVKETTEFEKAKKLSKADNEAFDIIKSVSGSDAKRKTEIANFLNLSGKTISNNLREFIGKVDFLPTDQEIANPSLIVLEKKKDTQPVTVPTAEIPTTQPTTEKIVDAQKDPTSTENAPELPIASNKELEEAGFPPTEEVKIDNPIIIPESSPITTTESPKTETAESSVITEQMKKLNDNLSTELQNTPIGKQIAEAARVEINRWNEQDNLDPNRHVDHFQDPHQLKEALKQATESIQAQNNERWHALRNTPATSTKEGLAAQPDMNQFDDSNIQDHGFLNPPIETPITTTTDIAAEKNAPRPEINWENIVAVRQYIETGGIKTIEDATQLLSSIKPENKAGWIRLMAEKTAAKNPEIASFCISQQTDHYDKILTKGIVEVLQGSINTEKAVDELANSMLNNNDRDGLLGQIALLFHKTGNTALEQHSIRKIKNQGVQNTTKRAIERTEQTKQTVIAA